MKVLIIASYPDSIILFRGRLIEALTQAGCEVHVAAPDVSIGYGARDELLERGVRLHEIPLRRTGTNPFADLGLLVSLFALIQRIHPTVTMPYTIKPVIYGTLAAWLARVPRRYALVTGLGYAFSSGRQSGALRIARILYGLALARASKVFFQNPDDEELFRALKILPDAVSSIVLHGSGVDVAEFQPAALPLPPVSFLLIARLLGDKGVREYAEAARRIKVESPHARFQLAGWIDTNPDAIRQFELDRWIAEGNLEFLGKLDDVRPTIAANTVYVLPSYREGTPRTVLEAMAMGRPIITTDAPGCRETVMNGENGYLVPVKSVDALVDAMQRFIDDPGLAAPMGKRSREIAEEKFDVHKVNAVMLREMGITEQGTKGAVA